MDKLRNLSRGQIIFLSCVTGISSTIAYDRYTASTLKSIHLEKARKLAAQPIGTTDEIRKLTVFISAVNTDEGYKLSRAFERYVKPVWDAAALDYEVYEGWEWYGEVRERVLRELNKIDGDQVKIYNDRSLSCNPSELGNEFINDNGCDDDVRVDSKCDRSGNGYVAFGRPAFKAILAAYQDYRSLSDLELSASDNGGEGESDGKYLVASTDEDSSSSSSNNNNNNNNRTWWQWLWGISPESPRTTPLNDDSLDMGTVSQSFRSNHPHLHTDLMVNQKMMKPVPPVGYIPYVVPRWWKRVASWFNERAYVEKVGAAALSIAYGNQVDISEMFPGDVEFRIEDKERSDKTKKNTENESEVKTDTEEVKETEQEEVKEAKLEVAEEVKKEKEEEKVEQEVVVISEEYLAGVKMYYQRQGE